jgi:two-component system nitrogen regulation sensor histidine kinase NtrY
MLAQAGFSFALEFEPLPNWALETARNHEVALLKSESDDRVRALLKLEGFDEAYLYVGRLVDPKVVGHMQTTQRVVRTYEKLEGRRTDLQAAFVMIFIVVALLLLLAAVLAGLMLATQLARPISRLVEAAESVRSGNLDARVEEGPSDDEIGTLSRAFNRMTSQLGEQRTELVEANRQLDLRRRFTEAVLSGVSAGVIGLDRDGRINLPNRSATNLLDMALENMIGAELSEAVPEMADLVGRVRRRPDRMVESQITVLAGGRPRTLLVRIAAEKLEGEVQGFVVTFDDVTELLSAQRKAAWADVARRIAHEIKNPLTPIQLSAERLKRKYLREIKSDPETFTICTDTIIRQVGDIGRMVDEFSSFARMPAPVMAEEDIGELCRRAVFLQKNAHAKIAFVCEIPDELIRVRCDSRQIGQALTNLLQNAAEAVSGLEKSGRGKAHGRVLLRVLPEGERTVVEIEDDGPGFPAHLRERLTEPYVTTRAKGTGLGLAIVKKIMEDHGGDLILGDRDGGGARVRMVFRKGAEAAVTETPGAVEPGTVESGAAEEAATPPGTEAERVLAHGS